MNNKLSIVMCSCVYFNSFAKVQWLWLKLVYNSPT